MIERIKFIEAAIQFVITGVTKRIDSPDGTIKAYKVKDIIRADIKNV